MRPFFHCPAPSGALQPQQRRSPFLSTVNLFPTTRGKCTHNSSTTKDGEYINQKELGGNPTTAHRAAWPVIFSPNSPHPPPDSPPRILANPANNVIPTPLSAIAPHYHTGVTLHNLRREGHATTQTGENGRGGINDPIGAESPDFHGEKLPARLRVTPPTVADFNPYICQLPDRFSPFSGFKIHR